MLLAETGSKAETSDLATLVLVLVHICSTFLHLAAQHLSSCIHIYFFIILVISVGGCLFSVLVNQYF